VRLEFIHAFSHSPLDRCNNYRTEAGFVASWRENPTSRFIVFCKFKPLLVSKKLISWKKWESIKHIVETHASTVVFLGKGVTSDSSEQELGYFTVDFSILSQEEASTLCGDDETFSDLRSIMTLLNHEHGAILSQAKSMVEWHARSAFCGKCGSPTVSHESGHKRVCNNCNDSLYPRSDPVMLVLVTRGDRCLLSHSKKHPPGVYTALAGFMEPGESIEECVRREVKEEAGVAVGKVTYHSSQPWPFPYSIMIGCLAEATAGDITIDDKELEDAQWFTREQVKVGLDNSSKVNFLEGTTADFRIPPALSLAHQVIRDWLLKNKL